MKLKILSVWLVTMAAVSVLHVSLNLGWGKLVQGIRETLGWERRTLYVGFLPVT